jgi:hypothetical protein
MVDTQNVKSFDDAMNHVGRDIKAWYVLRHTIDVVKASMSFPCNRKVLIGFIMRHRNMDITINKSKKCKTLLNVLLNLLLVELMRRLITGGVNHWDLNVFGKRKNSR